MFIAKQIAAANQKHRILVVGPRALAAMYEHELTQALPLSRILLGSRRNLRELEAEAEKGKPIWPAPAVVVMGMDTARQDDVLHHLCSTEWDLVILEEVHLYGRARWTLLKTILRERCFNRVLMVTPIPELKSIASLIKGIRRTEWIISELKDWDGKPVFPASSNTLSAVSYRRSGAEIELVENLLKLTEEFSSTQSARMVKNILLTRAASSPLALEQTIRRLRNSLAHDASDFLSALGVEGFDGEVESDDSAAPSRAVWKNKGSAMVALSTLVDQIELLTTDSKRTSLESLLGRLQREGREGNSGICIFCVAKATASYLKTILTKRGGKVWLFTSDQTSDELQTSLSGFVSQGGILVCTAIALQGVDLRSVETFIHYDPPANDREMFIRISRSHSAKHYLLKDESRILPKEWPITVSSTPLPKA
ncbi:MAG: polymerase-associated protein RapA [Verrucomicrobiota bacterium]|jgi:superfamily II DNA or RNA helicase